MHNRKILIVICAIAISLVIPFLRFMRISPEFILALESRDVLYLLAMMLGVSIGYAFILFEHVRKMRIRQPEQASVDLGRHLFPMTLLVCASNIALGLSTNLANPGHPPPPMPLCDIAQMCTGTSLIVVFPHVVVPNGVILYAFWGAFIFNCYQYLQRIVNNDFTPNIWLFGGVRLAAAILASMLVFIMFFEDSFDWQRYAATNVLERKGNVPPGLAVAGAFFAGFFPLMTLRVLYRAFTDRVSQLTPFLGKYVHTPLTVIDGITQEVQDRLAEAGIDSLQMLSRSTVSQLKDPIGAALPYPDDVLADWIDQSRLALYFAEEAELAEMRAMGIRTYSDLLRYQQAAREQAIDFEQIGLKVIPAQRFKAFVERGPFT